MGQRAQDARQKKAGEAEKEKAVDKRTNKAEDISLKALLPRHVRFLSAVKDSLRSFSFTLLPPSL